MGYHSEIPWVKLCQSGTIMEMLFFLKSLIENSQYHRQKSNFVDSIELGLRRQSEIRLMSMLEAKFGAMSHELLTLSQRVQKLEADEGFTRALCDQVGHIAVKT